MIKITTGKHMGSKNHPQWRLLQGSGARSTDYFIPYGNGVAYIKKPFIQVAIIAFDILKGTNHRIVVDVVDLRKDGFIVRYRTWADTKIWSAGISWMVIGKVKPRELAGDDLISEDNGFEGFDLDNFIEESSQAEE